MKFKVGDRVKVIGCDIRGNHCKNIGKIFTIIGINNNNGSHPYKVDKDEECFGDDELELVQEKQFHKADLKNGDIVTYRNGAKRTVIAKKLINSGGCIVKELDDYTDELKDRILGIDLDIVKVERPVKYGTVFERKEEILDETEKRYLSNIIRPFRDKVEGIEKCSYLREFIKIYIKEDEPIILPYLEKGTMYKGMEENKRYTLKELCL